MYVYMYVCMLSLYCKDLQLINSICEFVTCFMFVLNNQLYKYFLFTTTIDTLLVG